VCKHHATGYIALHTDASPKTPDVPDLGQTIRELRELRGWSLTELQAMTGVAAETIREWEKGVCTPRIASLHQVAAAFDASASDLLKDAGL
jgi:transcriptional regulator with XRE-family HTH domain